MARVITTIATLTLFGVFALYMGTHPTPGWNVSFAFENLIRGWAERNAVPDVHIDIETTGDEDEDVAVIGTPDEASI
jgi:hypothetical protein